MFKNLLKKTKIFFFLIYYIILEPLSEFTHLSNKIDLSNNFNLNGHKIINSEKNLNEFFFTSWMDLSNLKKENEEIKIFKFNFKQILKENKKKFKNTSFLTNAKNSIFNKRNFSKNILNQILEVNLIKEKNIILLFFSSPNFQKIKIKIPNENLNSNQKKILFLNLDFNLEKNKLEIYIKYNFGTIFKILTKKINLNFFQKNQKTIIINIGDGLKFFGPKIKLYNINFYKEKVINKNLLELVDTEFLDNFLYIDILQNKNSKKIFDNKKIKNEIDIKKEIDIGKINFDFVKIFSQNPTFFFKLKTDFKKEKKIFEGENINKNSFSLFLTENENKKNFNLKFVINVSKKLLNYESNFILEKNKEINFAFSLSIISGKLNGLLFYYNKKIDFVTINQNINIIENFHYKIFNKISKNEKTDILRFSILKSFYPFLKNIKNEKKDNCIISLKNKKCFQCKNILNFSVNICEDFCDYKTNNFFGICQKKIEEEIYKINISRNNNNEFLIEFNKKINFDFSKNYILEYFYIDIENLKRDKWNYDLKMLSKKKFLLFLKTKKTILKRILKIKLLNKKNNIIAEKDYYIKSIYKIKENNKKILKKLICYFITIPILGGFIAFFITLLTKKYSKNSFLLKKFMILNSVSLFVPLLIFMDLDFPENLSFFVSEIYRYTFLLFIPEFLKNLSGENIKFKSSSIYSKLLYPEILTNLSFYLFCQVFFFGIGFLKNFFIFFINFLKKKFGIFLKIDYLKYDYDIFFSIFILFTPMNVFYSIINIKYYELNNYYQKISLSFSICYLIFIIYAISKLVYIFNAKNYYEKSKKFRDKYIFFFLGYKKQKDCRLCEISQLINRIISMISLSLFIENQKMQQFIIFFLTITSIIYLIKKQPYIKTADFTLILFKQICYFFIFYLIALNNSNPEKDSKYYIGNLIIFLILLLVTVLFLSGIKQWIHYLIKIKYSGNIDLFLKNSNIDSFNDNSTNYSASSSDYFSDSQCDSFNDDYPQIEFYGEINQKKKGGKKFDEVDKENLNMQCNERIKRKDKEIFEINKI